ncbi:MAG: geranylgeranylglycerol-phosphate geranylgeranyltransferase [Calditrichia bacterium]
MASTLMNKIRYIISLARPVNVLITALSIGVAGLIAGIGDYHIQLLLAMCSAGLIAAAANSINDYFDIEIDRINKPDRPLPAGHISANAGKQIALIEYAVGNSIAAIISPVALAMALFFSALTFLYASHFKRQPIWGNMVVSLSTAAAFIYGGVAVNSFRETIYPATFAFFFHFGREIIKDMEDIEGDRAMGARTLPIVFGFSAAKRLIWLNFILLVLATLLPFYLQQYGITYMIIVLIGVYPVLGYCLFSIQQNTSSKQLNFLSNLLKSDMVVGLLAVYFR